MSSNKRIRQIVENIFGRDPMVYTVGQNRNLPIKNIAQKRTIYEIIDNETQYDIYIGNNETTQHWCGIGKDGRVNVFYFID